jgi:hypothetical protein
MSLVVLMILSGTAGLAHVKRPEMRFVKYRYAGLSDARENNPAKRLMTALRNLIVRKALSFFIQI